MISQLRAELVVERQKLEQLQRWVSLQKAGQSQQLLVHNVQLLNQVHTLPKGEPPPCPPPRKILYNAVFSKKYICRVLGLSDRRVICAPSPLPPYKLEDNDISPCILVEVLTVVVVDGSVFF